MEHTHTHIGFHASAVKNTCNYCFYYIHEQHASSEDHFKQSAVSEVYLCTLAGGSFH